MSFNSFLYGAGSLGGPTSPAVRSGRFGNTPSRNLLRNVVNTFRLTVPSPDSDGSPQNSYTLLATGLPCSVQPGRLVREELQGAIRQYIPYMILFETNPGLTLGDQVQWLDDLGTLHLITVTGTKNLAGRGSAFQVDGEELV